MQTIVRAAVERDMPAIMDLLRLKAKFDGCPEALVATQEQLHEAFFAPAARMSVLMAMHEDLAVGLATYHPTFSTYLARPGIWLDDLYVRDAYRSQGIGKALLSNLARIAKQQGCGRIEWTVALNNLRGTAFYERLGATVRHQSRCVRLPLEGIDRLAGIS